MKNLILPITLIFIGIVSYAQNTFFTSTFTYDNTNYTVKVATELDSYKFTVISDTSGDSDEFSISDLRHQWYLVEMKEAIAKISKIETKDINLSDPVFMQIFYNVLYRDYSNTENAPIAGYIDIYDSIETEKLTKSKPLLLRFKKWSSATKETLIVKSVEIVIKNGFIEIIDAHVYFETDTKKEIVTFTNMVPIGISTSRNLIRLHKNELFYFKPDGSEYSFPITNILRYQRKNHENSKDYSPGNTVLTFKAPSVEEPVYKESGNKLFELQIFTDFYGIKDDNPNGLAQTELNKRVNLYTRRYRVFKQRPINFGFFNHVELTGRVSKIDEKNRSFTPKFIEDSIENKIVYANTLDIYKHEAFSLGGNLSLATIDVPGIKSEIDFNLGINYGRTLFNDTINKIEDGLNSVKCNGGVSTSLFPDSRFSAKLSYNLNHLYAGSRYFSQYRDDENSELATEFFSRFDSRKYKTFYFTQLMLEASYNGEGGRIYMRYIRNAEFRRTYANFSQIQAGYSFYIKPRAKS